MGLLSNPGYENFAQAYAETGNARQSAIRSGFTASHAWDVLTRPEVAARVQEIASQRFAKASITPERVIKELARIAFHDPRDLFDDESGTLLPIHQVCDDAAAAISRVEVEVRSEGHGKDKEVYVVKKVRTHDKMAALNLLARHFKIVGEDSDGVNALANALADRLKNARVRQAAANREELRQQAEDAVILPHAAHADDGNRLEYGFEGDPSSQDDVTAPRLVLETPQADSIELHSTQRAVALPTVPELPAAEPAPPKPTKPRPQPQPAKLPEPSPPLEPYRSRLHSTPLSATHRVRHAPTPQPSAASEDDDEDLAG